MNIEFVGKDLSLSDSFKDLVERGVEKYESRLGLPKSITGAFQGLLLFALLACDTLVNYRIRFGKAR